MRMSHLSTENGELEAVFFTEDDDMSSAEVVEEVNDSWQAHNRLSDMPFSLDWETEIQDVTVATETAYFKAT